MVSHADAVIVIDSLPEVIEGTSYGNRAWKVRGSVFAWDRPFSKADLRRYGDHPVPSGPIVGLKVDGLDDKKAVLEAGTDGVFTIPHFEGFPAVLVQLDAVDPDDFRALVVDAWLATAPDQLTEAYLRDHPIG
ncbi:MAG: hypothetical protein CL424_09320 [Acidimicrobiaceae bacterium]|nr:hypothetical protein [Acidimicrobiaceae bacterium]